MQKEHFEGDLPIIKFATIYLLNKLHQANLAQLIIHQETQKGKYNFQVERPEGFKFLIQLPK